VKPLVPVGGTVVLRGVSVSLDTDIGEEFVADCARHIEGLIAEHDVMTKWGIPPEAWEALADNAPLLRAVRAERERRLIAGEAVREAAQREFSKAPSILGRILSDDDTSPRHRIEAARELRAVTTAGIKDGRAQGERFTITINLGADETRVFDLGVPVSKQIDGESN
jgi:hypothetical protein